MRQIDDRLVLSPTDLADFLACRHKTALELAALRGERERPYYSDPLADQLRKRGEEHEQRYVHSLRDQGLGVEDLTPFKDPKVPVTDRVARTMDAMRRGVDVIVQASLGNDTWSGYADVLVKVDGPSALGDWHYEAHDTKLARETRAGAILQLCVYTELLGEMQGRTPEHFRVVTPEHVGHAGVERAISGVYRFTDVAAYYRLVKGRLQQYVGHARVEATAVAFVHHETLDWRATQFSAFAILQLGMTQAEATYIADKCAGQVAVVSDPERGRPEEPDPFVGSIDQNWARQGRAASRFCDRDEFNTIQHVVEHSTRAATLGAYAKGIAMEFPFAEETSFARLDADEPHRRIGSGLRVRLFLPVEGTEDELVERANTLNRAEALGGSETMYYGAWCLDAGASDGDKPRLQYQVFFPNAFHRVGVAQDASYGVARRAQWVDWGMHGVASAVDPRTVMMHNVRTWLKQQSPIQD